MWKAPPLNSLRAFEAAGRHGSFKLAAAELCVTEGAVSRHIAKLEEFIGAKLFLRRHRQVELTPAGVRYLAGIGSAFRTIHEATASIGPDSGQSALKIKVPPTFAIKWLVPRMPSFQARYPNLSIQITTPFDVAVFEPDLDVAVSYGTRTAPDVVRELLFAEVLTPIVSAQRAAASPRCPGRPSIGDGVLLHSLTRPNDWRQWLQAAAVTDIDPGSGLRFENSGLVYQAVMEGLGIGIAQVAFVAEDIAAGRVVAPVATYLRNETGYFLVFAADRMRKPAARDFRDWIHDQAQRSKAAAAVDLNAPVAALA